jgi:hypothetical protein
MIGRSNIVSVLVRQGALDGVWRPFARLVQQRAGHGAEAMRSHLIRSEAHSAKRSIRGVLRDWPITLS